MKKRILALVLSLCMIFSMVPVMRTSAAGTEAEFSLDHIGYQGNYPRYLVYLNLAGVTDVSDTTVPGGSKVVATVNGVATNLEAYAETTSQVMLILGSTTLGNYLVEIDAGTAIGSYTVKSDLKIKIEEYTATQLEIIRLGIDTTVGTNGVIPNAGGVSRYSIALSGISGQSGAIGSLTVNGHSVSSGFEYNPNYPADGKQALFVYYDTLMSGVTDVSGITELQTISIPAGTIFGNCITENTLTFTLQQWTYNILPTEVKIESTNGSAWNGSQYIFYLHTDLSFTVSEVQAVKVLVDGTEQTLWLQLPNAVGPYIAGGSITEGEHKIVIPKGTKLGDCVTAEDYTFYTHADGSINTTPADMDFKITGINACNWRGDDTTPIQDWYFILGVDNTAFTPGRDIGLQTTSVTVDGKATTGYILNGAGQLAFTLETDLGEHTVVFPAGMKLGAYTLEATYTFYTHADGSADTTPPVDTTVAVTEISTGRWRDDCNDYLMILNVDNSAFALTAEPAWVDAGIRVDGADANGYFLTNTAVGAKNGQLAFVLNITKGEHTVVLPAGMQLGDYTLETAYTFYTHADGTADIMPQFSITGIATGQFRSADYWIILNTDNTSFKQSDSPGFANKGVTYEGIATGGYFWQNNETDVGKVNLVVTSAKGENKVTIPAGTVLGGFKLREAFTFYTHADGTVDQTPAGSTPVNIAGVNTVLSKHNVTGYHIYLNMSDPTFELASEYNQRVITVLVDGTEKPVNLWNNGQGSLLIDSWTNISLGYHEVTIPAGTEIGDYVLEKDYTFRTYSNGSVGEADRGEVILNNASAMMGGSYGDGLFYDFSGTFTGANWIVNALPADGDITFEYVKISEAKDDAWYGPVRMTNLNSQWPNDFGVVLHTTNGTFANDYGLTNMLWSYKTDEHKAYYRNAAGNLQIISDQYGYISSWDQWHTDNLLTSKDFAGIDEKGAQHFGVGWGGSGKYTLDWTRLMIYDAQGNDLGVAWHDTEANVTLTPMVEYGATVYLKPADNNGLKVTGWKVIDLEGNQVSVEATNNNGIWSFVVPENTASIEPIYHSVDLLVQDSQGKVLVHSNIAWLSENILLAEKQVKAAIPEGYVLMGYSVEDKLYASLQHINTENVTQLVVTAKTVQFSVEKQGDVRHGDGLADSGLRFVATLGQTEYIPKVLLISDSKEELTVADAKWQVGNSYGDFKQIELDGAIYYSIALTNIPAEDYSKTYYARAGILVTYADGEQEYIYSDTVSATVNEAAEDSNVISDVKTEYVNGVMNLDADAKLVGERVYSITANNASGNYTITYTGGSVKVSGLIIDGLRFTTTDGVVFGDNTVTVPGGLFANAKLKQELTNTGSMDIGAYFGPSIGLSQYTDKNGTVTDYSIKRNHDDVYADLEDYFGAGFNIWMAEDWTYGGTHYGTNDAFSALDLAAEYCINHGLTKDDIKVLVADQFINGLLDGTDMNNGTRENVATYAAIAEERINALINYNPTVNGKQVGTEYNCFGGYVLRDEPWYKHMKYYAGWFSFLADDAGNTANVTAWNTSGAEVNGNVSCMGLLSKGYTLYFSLMGLGVAKNYVTNSTDTGTCSEAEYVAYVKAFVDNVNANVWNYDNMVLAFDNYGLYSNASSSFGSTDVNHTEALSENWQQNMSLFADLVQSKNPNARFAAALRSFGMKRESMVSRWSSKTWKEFNAFDSAWGQQAVSMQAYTALAHGYDYINWFSYWEIQNQAYSGETFTDACVMWDANMNPVKQNMYYWVQSANAELRMLESLISNFTYKHTAAIAAGSSFYTGTGNVADTGMGGLWTAAELANNSALASITASVDTTAGYFTKTSGKFTDMFILVNMSHPNEKANDTVNMTFDADYTGVIVYLDGVASIYNLTNGACTVTLPSGEGAIVIPVK